ncbi:MULTISPECIES: MFS transporter [Paenibacillus]|uniref:MFS transporter n=1 Tax=Paenibacillus TaxID=44249 RepID=UPI0003856C28|nr:MULTISPECIES: tetracycline resistance MFS efflux pump [Paenibacillus]EPY11843.1 multidrug resistance protein [Paenibacillus alvei A6-6i-x]SDG05505.1 MFS transporter, DHA1 family, multidrug resistance protein [Paenibacillus sp. cl6col]
MSTKKQGSGSLVILMVNMFIAMVGMGLIIPIMPKYVTAFGATGQAMGYLVAAFGLTQFLCSPIAGELSDKYGRKLLIVTGIGLFTVSQLLFGMAEHMWMLYVSRLLGGMSAALMTPPMMAYVADITTEEKRGKGLGMLMASMTLGVVIGPGIGGMLAEYGIRVPFYAAAALAGLSTVVSLLFLPESLSVEERMAARSNTKKKENLLRQMAASAKAPYFMLLVLVFALTFGLQNFEAIFGLYVDVKYGFTPKDISLMITLGAIIGVICQAVLIERLLRTFGEKKILLTMFGLSAISMILLLFVSNYFLIFFVTMLFFVATSIVRPAINTLLSKMAGNEQGFVAGMNNAYMSLGNIIGPAIAGILFDIHVQIPYAFGAIVLLASAGMLIGWKQDASYTSAAQRGEMVQ